MAEPRWDDLRIFLAVARFESLSRAGVQLKMDPATLGRRIARLEADLSAVLFQRSPQGYGLTDAGLRLFDQLIPLDAVMMEVRDTVAGETGALRGQIRLGAPDGCANYILPQVCAKICENHPGLDVQIVAQPRVFNLSKREADMAITVSQPTTGRMSCQKLSDYKLHLVASERYLQNAPELSAQSGLVQLKHHRLIGYISDLIFDKELDYLSQTGMNAVNFASNSVSVQINWARQGAGVMIAHDFALPAAPELRRILTCELSLTRSFYLVRHADDRKIARLNRFAAELGPLFRQELSRLEVLAQQT